MSIGQRAATSDGRDGQVSPARQTHGRRRSGTRSGGNEAVESRPLLDPARDIDEADESGLVALVGAARAGDRSARNEIFRLFGPRIDRWVRREWAFIRRQSTGLEPGDLQSEAFLILTELIISWPGRDRFGVYVVHVFPLRLRTAARRLAGQPVRRRSGLAEGDAGLDVMSIAGDSPSVDGLAADESWEAEQTMVLLESIAGRLPDQRGQQILLWRVRDGRSLTQIARNLGLSRRQVYRIWNDITTWARENWAA